MAQALETPEQASVADGATASFPISFTFTAAAEIEVVTVDPDTGGRTLQVLDVDYAIPAGDWATSGGNVVFLTGHLPEDGARVERRRITPPDQPVPFGDDATFRPVANEDAFDKQTRLAQELRARTERGMAVPIGEAGPVLAPAATRADTLMIWNPDGSNIRTDRTLTEFDADVAAADADAAAALAALALATQRAQDAADALAAIIEIAAGAPDAPSILNKLNIVGDNVGASAATLRTNIGAADGDKYRATGSRIMRQSDDGFGIDAFPTCALHVGANGGIVSDPLAFFGRVLTGAKTIYGHTISAANDVSASLTGGDGEYAANDFDSRSTYRVYAYNHAASYQAHLNVTDGAIMRDFWGYVFSGLVSGAGSAMTQATGLLIANVLGNIGTQRGAYFADLTAGLTDNFAIYCDGATKSRLNKFGVQYDFPTGLGDFNALGSNNSSLVFRRGGTFQASFGTVGSADAVMVGADVDDMVTRLQNTDWHLTTNAGGGSALTVTAAGAVKAPLIGTTASAANVYADAAAGNSLLVSTSTRAGKADFDPLNDNDALAVALRLKPTWFSSLSIHDRAEDRFLGLLAEDVAETDPWLAHWTTAEDGSRTPSGVQYERVGVVALGAIANLDRRLRALEAAA